MIMATINEGLNLTIIRTFKKIFQWTGTLIVNFLVRNPRKLLVTGGLSLSLANVYPIFEHGRLGAFVWYYLILLVIFCLIEDTFCDIVDWVHDRQQVRDLLNAVKDQDDADAAFLLAKEYGKYNKRFGGAVDFIYMKQAELYRKAAERGNAEAQYMLGLCYGTGKGVEVDQAEAKKWYRKASEQGFVPAKQLLSELNNQEQA